MKILFLCGSLEPGRDGVGDYTRRLAGELHRQGHSTLAVALNDQHINEPFLGSQFSEGESLQVLRLPSNWIARKRFAYAKQWINKFKPDYISLQFVPFAFHKKGLPYTLGKNLLDIGQGREWHIMFHELWVGMERESPVKYRILGKAQRFLIQALINKLRPSIIHTQTQLYQIQLASLGTNAHCLPLFGNIPVANIEAASDIHIPAVLQKSISFVLFGNIHYSSFVQQFTDEAAAYSQTTGVALSLILLGRCGAESEQWISAWGSAGLCVEVLGEQSAVYISAILQKATFGLATTPTALVEKSGTAAAMREHGLRVICVGRPWHPRTKAPLREPSGMAVYQPGNFKNCISSSTVPSMSENAVSLIAERLLSHLTTRN